MKYELSIHILHSTCMNLTEVTPTNNKTEQFRNINPSFYILNIYCVFLVLLDQSQVKHIIAMQR